MCITSGCWALNFYIFSFCVGWKKKVAWPNDFSRVPVPLQRKKKLIHWTKLLVITLPPNLKHTTKQKYKNELFSQPSASIFSVFFICWLYFSARLFVSSFRGVNDPTAAPLSSTNHHPSPIDIPTQTQQVVCFSFFFGIRCFWNLLEYRVSCIAFFTFLASRSDCVEVVFYAITPPQKLKKQNTKRKTEITLIIAPDREDGCMYLTIYPGNTFIHL